MAFKMKGMYFGEGTGSAMKYWPGQKAVMPLVNNLLDRTGEAGDSVKDIIGKKDGDKKKDGDNKNTKKGKDTSIPRVNWDLEDIEMTEKIDESKKAVNRKLP